MTNQPKFLCDVTYGLRLLSPYCLIQSYRTILKYSHSPPFNCPGAISSSVPLQGQAPLLMGRFSSWWEAVHHVLLHTFLVQTVCFISRRSGELSKTIPRAGLLKWRIQDKPKSWINFARATPWFQTWSVCDFLRRVSCSFFFFFSGITVRRSTSLHLAHVRMLLSSIAWMWLLFAGKEFSEVRSRKNIKPWWKWSSIQFPYRYDP